MRIALHQCLAQPGDVAANLARLERTAAEAAAGGAHLLVCPEMGLTGYNIGAAAVQRLAEWRDGPSARAVAAIAQRHGLAIVHGYPERSATEPGAVYNSAQLTSAAGERVATYRKLHLYGGLDRAQFAQPDGDNPVIEFEGWRLGLLICYDVEFPEAVRGLAVGGAELILVPTANMIDFDIVPTLLVPARAWENQCYVAYANTCGEEGSIHYGGLSAVAAPEGRLLVQAGRDEALIYADVARTHVATARAHNPYLADRRPALYAGLVKPPR